MNVVAEEIKMKCKNYRYKFVSNDSGTTVYSANIKRDKKKYHKFCPSGIDDSNRHFLKSYNCLEAPGTLPDLPGWILGHPIEVEN